MHFHHELETFTITDSMEKSGYASLEPAITPEALRDLCKDDPLLMTCLESMNKYCKEYAHDVFNMMYEQKLIEEMRENGEETREAYEELVVIDRNRHNLHEAMMDSVNLVSRELVKKGKDNEWMRELVAGGRATYATFALLTFYKLYSTMNIPSQTNLNSNQERS